MASQIEQLRKQFDGYNNAQKKQFIDNLKAKLQTNKNPEYSKFLNECVSKYNASLRGGSSSSNDDFSDLLDGKGSNIGTGKTAFENRVEYYKANGYTIEHNKVYRNKVGVACLHSSEVADKKVEDRIKPLKNIRLIFQIIGIVVTGYVFLFVTMSLFVVIPVAVLFLVVPMWILSSKIGSPNLVFIEMDKTGKIVETGNVLKK